MARSAAPPLATPSAPPLQAVPTKRSRWWVELLAIAWLAWLYDIVTGLAPLRQPLAIAHGRALLRLEQYLHVAGEHSLNVWLAGHRILGTVLSYYYDNAHFVVTFGLLGWLWWKRADIYRPLRNALVAINLIGLLVFWLYPVAPPRMLKGFEDVIASSHTFGSWHTGSLASDADQLAAMPSLHIAWAVWCGVALWRMSSAWSMASAGWPWRTSSARWPWRTSSAGWPWRMSSARRLAARRRCARTLAFAYPAFTALVVLCTANHYLLDVLAGALTAAVAVAAVRLVSVLDVTKLLRSRRAGRLRAAADDAF